MKIEYPPVPDNSLFKLNADSNEWFVQMKNGLCFFIGDARTEPEMCQLLCDHMYRCWIDKAEQAYNHFGCVPNYDQEIALDNAELWRKLGKEMK